MPTGSSVRDELCPAGLLRNVGAGVVVGSMVVIGSLSFATLIFAGPLADLVGIGIGMALASGAIVGLVGALSASHPATVSGPHGSTSSVLALLAAGVAQRLAQNPAAGDRAATVVVAIACAGLLTGLFLSVLGWCRLGNFIRFIPYPVVGGFVAGTGWLLARGSMIVMTGAPLTWTGATDLLAWDAAGRWLPGTVLALGLLAAQRLWHRWMVAPAAIAAAIGAFHLFLLLTGTTLGQAREAGWLLPRMAGIPWAMSLDPGLLGRVGWATLVAESGTIATVVVLAAVVTLFGATTFELMTDDDVDLNRDLRGMGIANLATGAVGGIIGLPSAGFAGLSQAMGAGGRLAGVVAGLVCGAVLVGRPQLVELIPTGVLGGLVMFNGLSLLGEWLVDQRTRIPTFDYAVMVIIVAVMAWFGFLPGVAVGLVAAGLLFVVSYSRIDVVRHALTGETFQSSVERLEPNASCCAARAVPCRSWRFRDSSSSGRRTPCSNASGRVSSAVIRPPSASWCPTFASPLASTRRPS
jgi:SulP family sulfate permease